MAASPLPWVIVLAAGEGQRVRELTQGSDGSPVAKQFHRFEEDESPFQRTLRRALRLTTPERVTCVVAQHHQDHWHAHLASLPAGGHVETRDHTDGERHASPHNRAAWMALTRIAISSVGIESTVSPSRIRRLSMRPP